MMKICFLIGLFIFLNFKSLCQLAPGLTCDMAGCSTSGSYTNSTGIPSMGNWGCLFTTPNANWMSFGIVNSGSISLILTQTNAAGTLIDVDFALYGPFSSVSAGCPINAATPQVDCSYSASGTENIDIPFAQVGQVYILLVTNYNGNSGTISIQPNTTSIGEVDCSVNFSLTTTTSPAKCGLPNGSVTITPSGGFAPYTYTITPPAGIPSTSSIPTFNNLTPGIYSVQVNSSPNPSGVISTITGNFTIAEILPMNLVIANQQNITCNSASDGTATIAVTLGSVPYTYDWDISASISNVATDLNVNTHTLTVTDNLGCEDSISVIINQPDPLSITFVTPDSMICSESSILLQAQGSGGSTPYTFAWTQNGSPIGNGQTITVDPINTGTIYCVTLSEQCGSPIPPQECLTITFPTPIIPITVPDDSKKCLPGNFIFSNTSINGDEIATMDYVFSYGFNFSTSNLNSLSATFPDAGVYDVGLTVTSIYGCIYTSQIPSIIEVTPLPIAGFTISKNPATWFETTIQTNDISFGNISSYVWSSDGASNIISNGNSAFISYPEGITGNYDIILLVTDTEGCFDITTLTMEIVPDIIFYAPNSFTPDDDEHNQSWSFYIEGIDLANFNLKIYNRWGEVIWETNDSKAEWDGYYKGLKVQSGTYNWRASYKNLDNDDKMEKVGVIHVIR